MIDEELARFKAEIDLVDFMTANGCNVVRRYTNSVELRGHGGKFYVRRVGNDYVFKDFLNDRGGTIIDYCQQYLMAGNLGEVRKMLRDYSGIRVDNQSQRKVEKPKEVKKTKEKEKEIVIEKNPEKIRQNMKNFKTCVETGGKHDYLQKERKILSEILLDSRFANRVMIDNRGNAIFPHYDKTGICGYEIKNKGFTGFSLGGEKGLWYSRDVSKAQKIVITESAIDAMSHAQLRKTDASVGYVSIGGAMSEKQEALLKSLIEKAHSRGTEVVLGLDNDTAGDKLCQKVRAIAGECGAALRREVPTSKDWNDDLRQQGGLQTGEWKKEELQTAQQTPPKLLISL